MVLFANDIRCDSLNRLNPQHLLPSLSTLRSGVCSWPRTDQVLTSVAILDQSAGRDSTNTDRRDEILPEGVRRLTRKSSRCCGCVAKEHLYFECLVVGVGINRASGGPVALERGPDVLEVKGIKGQVGHGSPLLRDEFKIVKLGEVASGHSSLFEMILRQRL